MAKKPVLSGFSLHLTAGEHEPMQELRHDTPFRILLMGDFSGRGQRQGSPAMKKPLLIDRDNWEEVLAKLDTEIHLPLSAEVTVTLPIKELDDFHPDRIYQRVALFGGLRDTRQRLLQPATFEQAAAEVRSWRGTTAPAPAPAPTGEPAQPTPSGDLAGLLDQVLGQTQAVPEGNALERELQSLIRQAVAPYLVPKPDPSQDELVECVDQALTGQMRAVLHHPHFQAVESAWRAVYFLTKRLDTDENLKIFLLDITKEEIAADLQASDQLQSSALYKQLVEQTVGTPGAAPWSVLVGNFTFDQTVADADLLARLGVLAQHAGAPFLGGAHEHLLGCESLVATPDPDDWSWSADEDSQQAWQSLRQMQGARFLALALPRFLLRLPYSRDNSPVESFTFEETTTPPNHDGFLWGTGAFACACMLGQLFNRAGWSLETVYPHVINNLPLYVYQEDDEARIMPCAELVMFDRAINRIGENGLVAVLSVNGSDRIRVDGLRSLALPAARLAGRWQ